MIEILSRSLLLALKIGEIKMGILILDSRVWFQIDID